MQNELLINIIVAIILFIFGLVIGRYWNKKLLAKLEKQNMEQKEILKKSYKLIGDLNKQIKPMDRSQDINKLIGELAYYGIKEWGKKKIDDLLYPDEYE